MIALNYRIREEQPQDLAGIRRALIAAFPTDEEARLVENLRKEESAWIPSLSIVAVSSDGEIIGYALLTRCHVGSSPALALAPVAVIPEMQGRGVGTAVTKVALENARVLGEQTVIVLGHPEYYPRFGFERASSHGIALPFNAPDDACMVLALDVFTGMPSGRVRYAAAFGIDDAPSSN